jgi:hypothetical protein
VWRCTIGLASSRLGRVWPVGISLSHRAPATLVAGRAQCMLTKLYHYHEICLMVTTALLKKHLNRVNAIIFFLPPSSMYSMYSFQTWLPMRLYSRAIMTYLAVPSLYVSSPAFPKLSPRDPKGCRFWFYTAD